MFLLLFVILAIPLLTSRTPIFITAMILLAELIGMFVLTVGIKDIKGNYIPLLTVYLILNIIIGVVNYVKHH